MPQESVPRGVIEISKCMSIKGAEDTLNKPYAFELATAHDNMFFIADTDKAGSWHSFALFYSDICGDWRYEAVCRVGIAGGCDGWMLNCCLDERCLVSTGHMPAFLSGSFCTPL